MLYPRTSCYIVVDMRPCPHGVWMSPIPGSVGCDKCDDDRNYYDVEEEWWEATQPPNGFTYTDTEAEHHERTL